MNLISNARKLSVVALVALLVAPVAMGCSTAAEDESADEPSPSSAGEEMEADESEPGTSEQAASGACSYGPHYVSYSGGQCYICWPYRCLKKYVRTVCHPGCGG